MASSDDEDVIVPDAVTNYHFVDAKDEPISLSELPLQWNESESPDGDKKRIFLHGMTDDGLQKLYKQVTAWKYDFSGAKPDISVLSKENIWIKLLKPRKSFEHIIRTVLITVHCLHFFKKNPEASGKALWDHLSKVFSAYEVRPSQNDLIDHMDLISEAVKRDEVLTKSQFLVAFLEEKPRKRKAFDEDAGTTAKPGFIVDDMIDEPEEDDLPIKENEDESDEESDLFNSVCAMCDNGGVLLCCEGKCLRSFHATLEAGSESACKSLGYSNRKVEEIQNFLCPNCQYNQHQCFACGELGSSDKSSGAEVFRCSSATCGHFFHPRCVSKLLHRESESDAAELQGKIASGEPFTCPAHKCNVCKQGENESELEFQFALCRRCPRSYHRKCLPRKIVFESSEDDDDIIQRAWEGLLPKSRILIYCLKHEIDDEIETPKRNHIKFPNIGQNKKQQASEPLLSKRKEVKEKNLISERTSEKRSVLKPQKGVEKLSSAVKLVDSSKKRPGMLSGPESSKKQKVDDSSRKSSNKISSTKVNKSTADDSKPSLGSRLFALMNKGTEPVESKKDDTAVGEQTAKPLRKETGILQLDADSKKRILAMMEDAASSVTLEEVIKMHKVPTTHRSSSRFVVDKQITLGKVEGSVEALRLALKKLEVEGCSIEDAKAVCDPGILSQILRWKNKLKVYLAPFLYGMRYTSFGRHFTKEDKLKEIVDMLHWYVEEGDMIVDFCCGANDFSILMKKRLDEMGKNCLYKNYDVMQTKNDFNFEQRDWMSVRTKELPPGSQLIMGLNPPFGVNASLANQFIDKALQFKPKLIVLIVPPETERLDRKKCPYDLVWEDDELLAGKSFYLPGSVDTNDKQIEQWNNTPPPLYLWSRPDFTGKHKAIAQKHGHCSRVREELRSAEHSSFSDFLMENHELNGEIPTPLDSHPVKKEEPVLIPDKAAVSASVTESHKEGVARDSGGAEVKESQAHGKDKSNASSKKSNRGNRGKGGKGKWGRGSDEISPEEKPPKREMSFEEKQKGRNSLPRQSPALDTPLHTDIGKEGIQLFDHPVSGSHLYHDTGYGRTREDDVGRRYSTNTEEPSFASSTYGRLDGPSLDPDYGIRKPEVQFPGYQRENIDSRGYNRSYIDELNANYGMESDVRSSLTQRGTYLSGHGPGFSAPYGHLGSAADPSYNRMSTSTMQRYAPRLDELNHTRMKNNLGPEPPSVNRVGAYDPSVPRPGFRVEPLGFAPSPYRLFSQHNSSGWLNE